jgi:hypothetical protein
LLRHRQAYLPTQVKLERAILPTYHRFEKK